MGVAGRVGTARHTSTHVQRVTVGQTHEARHGHGKQELLLTYIIYSILPYTLYMSVCVCMSNCVPLCMYMYTMYVCIHVCMYIRMYRRICLCICIHVCVHVYVCIVYIFKSLTGCHS